MRRCPSRSGAVVLGLLLAASIVHGSDRAASWRTEPGEGDLPGSYLQGLDLELPAQEAFRGWPPRQLVERPYWLPWSWLSLQRASLFNRPIFLVLTVDSARASKRLIDEVLSDPRVLRTLNAGYVSIMVNADLRPDLRERYQTGAWPSVAFLLPNGKPLLSQANDLGLARPITTTAVDAETMLFLLREGTVYWNRRSDLLMQVGEDWARREGPTEPLRGTVDAAASQWMTDWLLANADRSDGGFGAVPKHVLPGLEEYAGLRRSRGLDDLSEQSRITLERLVASPLFDAREGGVHRIATQPSFTGIEYEKMLAGNAALLRELTFALRARDSEPLREALAATGRFLLSVLARPGGGFYLAQRADPASPDGGGYWNAPAGEAVAPALDKAVLAGPNAVAGAALMRAGLYLGDEGMRRAGRAALELVFERALLPGGSVRHAIEPAPSARAYLVSQADVALAFADAYETTGEARYLVAAQTVADFARANLHDPYGGGLRDHVADPVPLGLLGNPRRPLRPNVRLARAMLRLSAHGMGQHYREDAMKILFSFAGDLAAFRTHGIEAALAIEEAISEPLLIRLSGAPSDPASARFRRAAINSPWPWLLIQTGAVADDPVAGVELRWNGARREVAEPEAVHEAIRDLIAASGS